MPKTYATIQWLRAVAALMVVFFHLRIQIARNGGAAEIPEWLAGGVDVFFVISGFIMWTTTANANISPWDFFRKRIVRIVPLYWALTAFMSVGLLVAPRFFQSAALDLGHVISSFLFIPFPHPTHDAMEPLLVPGWTLNYEMFFYLLFGVALVLPPAQRLVATCGVLVGLALVGAIGTFDKVAAFYTHNIIIEFAFGLLLGRFFERAEAVTSRPARSLRALPGAAAIALGLFAMAKLSQHTPGLWRGLIVGLPATMIVGGFLLLETSGVVRIKLDFLRKLGDASYSLYLSHGLTLSAFGQLWRRAVDPSLAGADIVFCVMAVAASCLIALLVHAGLEQPLTRFFNSPTRRQPLDVAKATG